MLGSSAPAGRATLELFDEAQAETVGTASRPAPWVLGTVRLALEVGDSEATAERLRGRRGRSGGAPPAARRRGATGQPVHASSAPDRAAA